MSDEEVVAAMNFTAGKDGLRRSPRKLGLGPGSGLELRPTKVNSTSPDDGKRHQSGRLKSRRTSTALPTGGGRRNSMSIPDDEQPNEQVPQRSKALQNGKSVQRPKPLKLSSKRGPKNTPFKSQQYGSLDPEHNSHVNLDESPLKKPRGRATNPLHALKKIQQLKKADTHTEQTKKQSQPQEDETRETPTKQKGVVATGSCKRRAEKDLVLESPNKRSRSNDVEDPAIDSAMEPEVMEIPVSAHQNEEVDDDDDDDEDDDYEEEEQSEKEGEEDRDQKMMDEIANANKKVSEHVRNKSPANEAVSSAPRKTKKKKTADQLSEQAKEARRQEEAKQSAEQVEEEEAQRLLELREKFVAGIEEAARVGNCLDRWRRAGGAALQIREIAGDASTRSKEGSSQPQRAGRAITAIYRLRKSYKAWKKEKSEEELQELEEDISDHLQTLKIACKNLKQTGNAPKDREAIQDIYSFVIPNMLPLLKTFLEIRYQRSRFSEEAIAELVSLLECAQMVCNTAANWQPRPSMLDHGVLRMTRHDIASNVKLIYAFYKRKLDNIQLRTFEAWRTEQYNMRQIEALEWANQRLAEQRSQDREIAQRRIMMARNSSGLSRPRPIEDDILDIDDIEPIQPQRPSPSRIINPTDPYYRGKEQTYRKRQQRQATEEIPAPPSDKWSPEETMALLEGLRTNTEDDRYEAILNEYGQDEGPLEFRDIDDLMKQAKWLKDSMTAAYGQLSGEWHWLCSVDAVAR